jgi:3',5'-cyclic AMP phosphodiesterase CpdA
MSSTLLRATMLSMLLSAPAVAADDASCLKPDTAYQELSLGRTTSPGERELILRFVHLSDVHIYDDDGSPIFNGNELEPVLEPTIANGSAQRLQDEYTDEVLNAMVATIDRCNRADPIALMIATGDNTDTMTLNEVRRYIDNLDGVAAGDTAYEANCGYTTVDSNGKPKLGSLPCPEELRPALALPTGKLRPDAQTTPPDPSAADGQFMPVRSPRQNLNTVADALLNGSYSLAPGLPLRLRCDEGAPDCPNHRLDVPYFVAFGNHDGAVRGTVTMQRPFQAGTLVHGRYFFQSQREWIDEFFFTTPEPGPVGHGFQFAGARLEDPDDRNDGWYVFGVVPLASGGWKAVGPDDPDYSKSTVRMIVLNTLYDGVRSQLGPGGPVVDLHRSGATNAATQGVVGGNEVTDPIGLEQGVLSDEQYEWLAAELASAAAARVPVLVFSHHPDRSFSDRRLGFPADGGKTAAELDELLGRSTHGGLPSTFLAHFAGHTHENVIRPCRPGPGGCPIGPEPAPGDPVVERGFWRIETASLIDYPQEGRIVELFALVDGGVDFAIRLTMISPDPEDPFAAESHRLSIAEATCNVSQMLGGPVSSGPYDRTRLETVVDNAGEAAVRGKFCFGEASLALAAGDAADRDVFLRP